MKVKLKSVRLAFPDLFEAVPFEEGAAPRYSATFLIEPGSENDKAVQAALEAVAQEAWPKDWQSKLEQFRGNSNKFCYVKGNPEYDGFTGMMALSSHRRVEDRAPTVLGRNKEALTAKDGIVYGGCYVYANVDIWAQTKTYPGLRCSLLGVQFEKDGDAFSGVRPSSPDEFDDLGVGDEELDDVV